MKKMFNIIISLLCVFTLILLCGCGKSNSDSEKGRRGDSEKGRRGVSRGGTKTNLSLDGVEYRVEDGYLIINGSGTVTKEAIDSILPEYNVVNFFTTDGSFDIADDAFNGMKNITHVTLGSDVHNIGARAFKGCSMPVIALGSNIETIDEDAFADNCIDIVLINNEEIFKNYNTKNDFGKVGVNASAIYVHKMVVFSFYDGDYSTCGAEAGDYLDDNGAFEYISYNTQQEGNFTQTANFNQVFGEHNFLRVFSNDTSALGSSHYRTIDNEYITVQEYKSGNESIDYLISSDYWDDKDIDIEFFNTSYLSDNPGGMCNECLSNGYSHCQGHDCDICDGQGSITCSGCGGSGKDPLNKYTNYKCTVCGGAKTQICPNCDGAKKIFNG